MFQIPVLKRQEDWKADSVELKWVLLS